MCITPRCASLGVKLHGMHPTTESSSAVCIAQRSQVIKIFKKLCSVHPTAESDSAVCITPLSQTLWCASHRGVWLRVVHLTAESSSAVCIIQQSLTLRCASHRRVSTYQASVLIRSFTNVISLWCLKILMWKLFCYKLFEEPFLLQTFFVKRRWKT